MDEEAKDLAFLRTWCGVICLVACSLLPCGFSSPPRVGYITMTMLTMMPAIRCGIALMAVVFSTLALRESDARGRVANVLVVISASLMAVVNLTGAIRLFSHGSFSG
jgi:hypothetical protein